MHSIVRLIGTLVTLALTSACSSQSQRSDSTRTDEQHNERVQPPFTFETLSIPCAPPLQEVCTQLEPIAWSDSEKRVMTNLVEQLFQKEAVSEVVETVAATGYGHFYKFRWGLETNDGGKTILRAHRVNAWIGAPDNGISVNQRFVDIQRWVDPLQGFDVKALKMLHEFFHVIDRKKKVSDAPQFRSAFEDALGGVDRRRCLGIRSRYLAEGNAGKDLEAWTTMRNAIKALPTGNLGRYLPSGTVCLPGDSDRFREGFAEYAAFWHLDPSAATYFPRPIATWLQEYFSEPPATAGQ